MVYLITLIVFTLKIISNHIIIIIDTFLRILVGFVFTLILYCVFLSIYIRIITCSLTSPVDIVNQTILLEIIFWIWYFIWFFLPFVWFLIVCIYQELFNLKTLEEASEMSLTNDTIALWVNLYIKYIVPKKRDNKGNIIHTSLSLFNLFELLLIYYLLRICEILFILYRNYYT